MTYVLVVDDEGPVRALLRDVLEMQGYDVREAVDGPAAVAAVAEERPDAVVLDIMMPGLSGLEVLRGWRAHAGTSTMPVLLLTAANDDETTWAGWTAGANYYLPKPFDPDVLLQWIERILADTSVSPHLADLTSSTPPPDTPLLRELRSLSGD